VINNRTSSSLKLQHSPTNCACGPPFTFGVEEPRLRFVGRKKELNELKAALSCGTQLLWLVAGPGGMGKSQLMKKFLFDVKNENNCVWLHGENTASLQNSVNSLGKKLEVPNVDRNDGGNSISSQLFAILEIIRSLLNNRTWIFVIDNIDENHCTADTVITTLMQRSNIKTFVTSRLRNVVGGSPVLVEVKQLSDEDAQTFIHDSLPIQQSSERVSELCTTLQNHPLALNQAIDYIKQEQLSSTNENYCISDYLSVFHSQAKSLLNHKGYEENSTVFSTYHVSVNQIGKKHGSFAIGILHRLAYFNPDGVSLPFLIAFLKMSMCWSSRFEDGLALLKTFSLIWIENDVITVHRLVQQITMIVDQSFWSPIQHVRLWFDSYCVARIGWNVDIIEIVNQRLFLWKNHANLFHAVYVNVYGFNHSDTIRQLLELLDILLYTRGLAEAEKFIESELALARQSSSGEKTNVLFIMKFQTRLLKIYLSKGNKREAEELKGALWIRSELDFGKNHRNTFKVKRDVMRAYQYQGRDLEKANEIKQEIEVIQYQKRSHLRKRSHVFLKLRITFYIIIWVLVNITIELVGLGCWSIKYLYDNWNFKIFVDPWGL
jgi:hypothetical protein